MDSFFSHGRLNFDAPPQASTKALMKSSPDADTANSPSGFPARPTFAGNPNASTTSAWSSRAPANPHAASGPSSPNSSTAYSAFGAPTSQSLPFKAPSSVKELSGETLDNATTTDPAILIQDVDVLRLYVDIADVPFALLDSLHTHSQLSSTFHELHICVQLSLRPALQDIQNSIDLKRAITSTMRSWAASSTILKFYFPLPSVQSGASSSSFNDYQEVDLWTAVAGLDEATVELTEILRKAEGRSTVGDQTCSDAEIGSGEMDDAMDLDGCS
jgi:hypothetical protein